MPFITVNAIQLYYETFGDDPTDPTPIVLIHGSTQTGRADWQTVAPLLAAPRAGVRYRVIVPDCRGHGQSDGTHTYSFKELADDVAGLIRALGYERAHLIGHSNGGNVVLVTLLEHPDVVQSCIPQAANAYVSADLIEKEPAIFDPDRVARDDRAWMDDMIALHGSTHGPDYWRELLTLTVREIISAPDYTANDLASVTRPVLVIQGEVDRVNAPMKHAQFIARHIPLAELWIPSGAGHNVHKDIPLAWLERVTDFWQRRGDDVNDRLYRLKREHYADARETIFEVRYQPPAHDALSSPGALTGRVLTAEQQQAAHEALFDRPAADTINVLLTADTPWALVNRPVADVRREPRSGAEQVTQLIVGEVVRVLAEAADWSLIRMERDGYLGWTRTSALYHCERQAALAYRADCNTLVSVPLAPAFEHPMKQPPQAGQLPWGTLLPYADKQSAYVALRLPDERLWWVKLAHVMAKIRRPRPTRNGLAATLEQVRQCVGVPYLWGGCSPFGYDCSGLAQAFYGFMGVSIPRDADQQFRAGTLVAGKPQPGDLLFFGGDDDDSIDPRHAQITHVAISLGGDEIIHANGTTWNIAYNSLDPASPIYRAWLKEHLVGVRRFR